MEILLRTNRDDQVLKIIDMVKDGFILYVNSNGYSGSNSFYHYETNFIDAFITDLSELETRGTGIAKLIDVEDNELIFSLDKLGHVEVSGKLIPHSNPPQELKFGFKTDQTCLSPFIADLKKARDTVPK